ncbi:MAG: Na+/H+ antiporter subunit D [Flavobacteriaceae bacterium]|nr:Na+/H+ antiporter subunit D [Flavobacteriaceae bacterium]
MSEQLIILPLLINLVLSIGLMFFWTNIKAQKVLSISGSFIAMLASIWVFIHVWENGIQTFQAGSWEAPFGITFVGDTLAATLVLLTGISAFAVSIFAAVSVIKARLRFGFFSVFHFLIMGLNGAFLTGDMFNLYVWFEIIIISSFVLISLGGEKNQLEGAVKYFTLNFLASMIFLTGLGVLYGLTGTLNMADLSQKIPLIQNQALVDVTAFLFLVGFGIKSAVFPLYFWLPASYHTPPSAVSAIFSGLLTKVGVYALIRVFTLIFVNDSFIEIMLQSLAILTIFSGGIGAIIQKNIRKLFSYLIICHIGFMIGGLGLFTEVAMAGVIFYLIHDIVVKTNLFLVSGLIYRLKSTTSLDRLGGIYKSYPKLSLLMAIPLFSLVGIPPLSGFWPKLSLLLAGFNEGNYWYFGAVIFGSLVTLIAIAHVWAKAFWEDGKDVKHSKKFIAFDQLRSYQKMQYVVPIVFLALVSLYIGFGAEHIQQVSTRIATEVLDKQTYFNAVFK